MNNSEFFAALSRPVTIGEHLKYYLDENVDRRIINPLRQQGITVITVEEQGLKGEKDDDIHLVEATRLGCVLVTADPDFVDIHERVMAYWMEQGECQHAGIIFISTARPRSPGEIAKQLANLYRTRHPDEMINLLLYL
jgi:hypothetical protein